MDIAQLTRLVKDKEGKFKHGGEVIDAEPLGQIEIREPLDFIINCEGYYDPTIRVYPTHIPAGANAYHAMNGKQDVEPLTQRMNTEIRIYTISFYKVLTI